MDVGLSYCLSLTITLHGWVCNDIFICMLLCGLLRCLCSTYCVARSGSDVTSLTSSVAVSYDWPDDNPTYGAHARETQLNLQSLY